MSQSFFSQVQRWRIPQKAFADSLRDLALDGARENEGIVLWLGNVDRDEATISHLIMPRGHGVIKQPVFLRIAASVFNEITDIALEHGIKLLGQIHSHGLGFGTVLSETDEAYGVRVPYYLSVVAPDFGMRPDIQLEDCGVFVFEPQTGYRRMDQSEMRERVLIVPSDKVTSLAVRED